VDICVGIIFRTFFTDQQNPNSCSLTNRPAVNRLFGCGIDF